MSESQEKGIIGQTDEGGLPVIFKFVDELPPQKIREHFRWLTVILWKYDGSDRNGMPPDVSNRGMIALEHAIDSLEYVGYCQHAYSRTGNNLKELVYYITDRDRFLDAFNKALTDHPRYPIEINFYEDQEWADFQTIRKLFMGK